MNWLSMLSWPPFWHADASAVYPKRKGCSPGPFATPGTHTMFPRRIYKWWSGAEQPKRPEYPQISRPMGPRAGYVPFSTYRAPRPTGFIHTLEPPFQNVGHTRLIIGGGHEVGHGLHLGTGITHGHATTRPLQHLDVIGHIPKGDHILLRHPEQLRQV